MEEIKLDAIEATPENFKEFGQVIEASPDDAVFGPHNAQLDLSKGIPRFYIMRLEDQTLKFKTITQHASVTQCIGSVGGHTWYVGVTKPSIVGTYENADKDVVKKSAKGGHLYAPPHPAGVRAFKISGPKFVKFEIGTWHIGPLFKDDSMDFYNLELTTTSDIDLTTHSFAKENGVRFEINE